MTRDTRGSCFFPDEACDGVAATHTGTGGVVHGVVRGVVGAGHLPPYHEPRLLLPAPGASCFDQTGQRTVYYDRLSADLLS